MAEQFDYTSAMAVNMAQLNREKQQLLEAMCAHFDVERKAVRLRRGMITLYGVSTDTGQGIPLTSTIGDFNRYVQSDSFSKYYLVTSMAVQ